MATDAPARPAHDERELCHYFLDPTVIAAFLVKIR